MFGIRSRYCYIPRKALPLRIMNRKFVIALIFAILALILGVYELLHYEGRRHTFVGIFWIVYSLVNLFSLPKSNKESGKDA